MKKRIFILVIVLVAGYIIPSKENRIVKNSAKNELVFSGNINEKGPTIKERIRVPDGFKRLEYSEDSFQYYIQNYILKPFGAKVINYDGKPYVYQNGHVGVMDIPVPSNGLQQCADALIRIRAEFLWDIDQKDKIGFNFTSGHYCSWKKYAKGYRPIINGTNVSFYKTAPENATKDNFYKYLNLIYTYSGTQTLYNELNKIESMENVEVGDLLINPGSPGHVVLVVDVAANSQGKKMVIFAQGNTPAQSVHIIKNNKDSEMNPWFEVEIGQYLDFPIYNFRKVKFIRFKEI